MLGNETHDRQQWPAPGRPRGDVEGGKTPRSTNWCREAGLISSSSQTQSMSTEVSVQLVADSGTRSPIISQHSNM